jgi:pSer/pThr/pTyr-binding forkhead associated (FHA) protein
VLVGLLAGAVLILRARPRRAPPVAPGQPPRLAPARLVVVRGSANVAFADLYGVVTIGRDPSNTLALNDPEASRQHARVDFVKGMWVVSDLNSSNGTLVNGVRITQHALRPGDQIQIGQTVLAIEFLDKL